ncbi:MAG: T9SS type A sorting domain-containing protein [Saprospiraceae bacterium]|nr:T9SS type A sorting domain-containing protein [Saprospiraceae bacterium]
MQIKEINGKYFLSTFNSCGTFICDGISEIDIEGNLLNHIKINHFSHNLHALVQKPNSDTLIYTGERNLENKDDEYFMYIIESGNLTIIDSTSIKEESNPFYNLFQNGTCFYNNNLIVSGDGLATDIKGNHSLVYFLYPDYTIDTLLTFQFTRGNTNIWEQYVDHDGLLTFHFWYDNFDEYEFRSRIIKINEDKEVVWDWVSPPIQDAIKPYGFQHSEGFTVVCLPEWNHRSNVNLVAINQDGTTRWSHFFPEPKIYKKRYPARVKEMRNGDILVMGYYDERDYIPGIFQAPFMCRYSKEGKLLWERTYFTDYGASRVSTGLIFDMIEHDDGRIMAVGQIREGNVPPYTDILILTTDADGCITPGCGVLNKLNDLISETEEVEKREEIEVKVSPNPIHDVIQLIWEKNRSEDIMIRIFDPTGEIKYIGKGLDGHIEIDAKNWTSGMYIIQYQTQKGIIQYQKMIKL